MTVQPDDADGGDEDDGEESQPEEKTSRTGGDYFGNQKWAELKAQIAKAEDGDTLEMSATGLPWFPSSVARALKGRDVTLEIRKNGVTYTLNGEKIGLITKLWYNFDENLEIRPAACPGLRITGRTGGTPAIRDRGLGAIHRNI